MDSVTRYKRSKEAKVRVAKAKVAKAPVKAKAPAVVSEPVPVTTVHPVPAGTVVPGRKRPKDIGAFIRDLFEKHDFSAVEEMVVLAKDPPQDMKTSERIQLLKTLSEYEAPKAKSESLLQQGARESGIQVTVVQFGSQAQVRPKVPESDYREFLPGGVGEENAGGVDEMPMSPQG